MIDPFLSVVPDGLYAWEDLCYVYPPFFSASCVVITHETGYTYRVHPGSVTQRTDAGKWKDTLRSLQAARPAYERFDREAQIAFYTRCTYIFCSYLWNMCISEKEAKRGIKAAAKRLHHETTPVLFREVTETALREGKILNRINRCFLSEIIKCHYKSAVLYCRLRTGISAHLRFLKIKRHGQV